MQPTILLTQISTTLDNNHALDQNARNKEEEKKKGKRAGKDNKIKGGPPRDQGTGNYVPDPAAEGVEHTTLGTMEGRLETYIQGATFDNKGEFKRRTDVTDHGRKDHPKPHYHDATSPNSAKTRGEAIANTSFI